MLSTVSMKFCIRCNLNISQKYSITSFVMSQITSRKLTANPMRDIPTIRTPNSGDTKNRITIMINPIIQHIVLLILWDNEMALQRLLRYPIKPAESEWGYSFLPFSLYRGRPSFLERKFR